MEASDEQKDRKLQKYTKKKALFQFLRRLLTIELNQVLLYKMIIFVSFTALDCAILGIEICLKHIRHS